MSFIFYYNFLAALLTGGSTTLPNPHFGSQPEPELLKLMPLIIQNNERRYDRLCHASTFTLFLQQGRKPACFLLAVCLKKPISKNSPFMSTWITPKKRAFLI